jgi:hypothetical protein
MWEKEYIFGIHQYIKDQQVAFFHPVSLDLGPPPSLEIGSGPFKRLPLIGLGEKYLNLSKSPSLKATQPTFVITIHSTFNHQAQTSQASFPSNPLELPLHLSRFHQSVGSYIMNKLTSTDWFMLGNNTQRVHRTQPPYPPRKGPLSEALNTMATAPNMDEGNPTEPQPQQNAVAQLRRGPNGWSGTGKFYRVMDNVIKIKNSDGDKNHVPTPEQRIFAYDEQDNFSQHVLLTKNDDLYQLWMAKIGPCLADWVLGKNPEGAFRHFR